MDIKAISPDQVAIWEWGPISLNATIVAKDSGKPFGFHYRAGLSGAPDSFCSS